MCEITSFFVFAVCVVVVVVVVVVWKRHSAPDGRLGRTFSRALDSLTRSLHVAGTHANDIITPSANLCVLMVANAHRHTHTHATAGCDGEVAVWKMKCDPAEAPACCLYGAQGEIMNHPTVP